MEEWIAIENENMLFQGKEKEKILQEKERLLQEKENERQFQLKMKELEMQDKTKSASLPVDPTDILM